MEALEEGPESAAVRLMADVYATRVDALRRGDYDGITGQKINGGQVIMIDISGGQVIMIDISGGQVIMIDISGGQVIMIGISGGQVIMIGISGGQVIMIIIIGGHIQFNLTMALHEHRNGRLLSV
jgi:hypothetical protein